MFALEARLQDMERPDVRSTDPPSSIPSPLLPAELVFGGWNGFSGYKPIVIPPNVYYPPGSIHTIPSTVTAKPPVASNASPQDTAQTTPDPQGREPSPVPQILVQMSSPPERPTDAKDLPDTEAASPVLSTPVGPPKIMIQGATRTNSECAPTPRMFSSATTTVGSPRDVEDAQKPAEAAESVKQPPVPDVQRDLPPLPDNVSVKAQPPRAPTVVHVGAPPAPRAPTPNTTPAAAPAPVASKPVTKVNDEKQVSASTLPPWDVVAETLYAWVMLWEEDSLQRALEAISIKQEVRHRREKAI